MIVPEIDTPDWLEWRKTKIGASEAPIIMGACPFGGTPYKLWQKKLGIAQEEEESYAMTRGKDLEEMVRWRYNDLFKKQLEKAVLESRFHDWMIASLDGWDGQEAIEIKVSAHTYHELAKGNVPLNYFWQMQHQMFVADLPMMKLVAYHPEKDDMIITVVARDEDALGKMLEKELEFIQQVRTGRAPDLMDKDYKYMGDDEYFTGLERLYMDALKQKEDAEAVMESCRERMIKASDRPSYGKFLKLVRYVKKGNIDYSRIIELENVDLENYRKKSSEIWQIRKLNDNN